jgi:hypothetical protein
VGWGEGREVLEGLKELDADGNDVHVAKGKGEGGAVKERGWGGHGMRGAIAESLKNRGADELMCLAATALLDNARLRAALRSASNLAATDPLRRAGWGGGGMLGGGTDEREKLLDVQIAICEKREGELGAREREAREREAWLEVRRLEVEEASLQVQRRDSLVAEKESVAAAKLLFLDQPRRDQVKLEGMQCLLLLLI